jgi:hypothetical protein
MDATGKIPINTIIVVLIQATLHKHQKKQRYVPLLNMAPEFIVINILHIMRNALSDSPPKTIR